MYRNETHNWRRKIGKHNTILEDKSAKILNPPAVKTSTQTFEVIDFTGKLSDISLVQLNRISIPRWAIPLAFWFWIHMQLSESIVAAEMEQPKPKQTADKKDATKQSSSSHKKIQSVLSSSLPVDRAKTATCDSAESVESAKYTHRSDMIVISVVYNIADYKKTKFSQEEYLEKYQKFKDRLYQRVLPYVASKEILEKTDASKDFFVVVRPSVFVNGAQYIVDKNQIWVELNPHYSDGMLINMLRNEFFHQSICAKDKKEACLQKKDSKRLRAIINEGDKKIEEYKKLIADQEKNKDDFLLPKLQVLVAATENYLSFYHTNEISLKKHNLEMKNFQQLANGQIFIPAGSYLINDVATIVDLYVTLIQADENTMTHQYFTSMEGDKSPLFKAKTFVNDVIFRRTHFYKAGEYSELGEKSKTEEMASDIAQLPEQLVDLVYSGYCELLSKITNVRDYCHKYSPR